MKVKIKKRDGMYVGAVGIDCNGVPGRITATAVGDTAADALSKASVIAERIASDPVMARIVPPQAMAALQVTKGLAAAARQGLPTLRRAFSMLSPKSRGLAAHLAHDVADRNNAHIGELGFLPLVMLAAKYGPGAAKLAQKAYLARKARNAARGIKESEAEANAAQEAAAAAAADNGGEEVEDVGDLGAWWNPVTHTKMTINALKKLSPTHRLYKKLRKRGGGGEDDGGGEEDDGGGDE